jgi:hypothetical protein
LVPLNDRSDVTANDGELLLVHCVQPTGRLLTIVESKFSLTTGLLEGVSRPSSRSTRIRAKRGRYSGGMRWGSSLASSLAVKR